MRETDIYKRRDICKKCKLANNLNPSECSGCQRKREIIRLLYEVRGEESPTEFVWELLDECDEMSDETNQNTENEQKTDERKEELRPTQTQNTETISLLRGRRLTFQHLCLLIIKSLHFFSDVTFQKKKINPKTK